MKNKNEKLLLVGILIIALALALYIIINSINKKTTVNYKQNSFQTLTNNQNDVEFQITPLSTSEFQITINTHSVNLDFDLIEISTLYDDIGNIYKPIKWEGSPPGGHHREGILKFSNINKNAKSIKLVINDGIEREFSWNIR